MPQKKWIFILLFLVFVLDGGCRKNALDEEILTEEEMAEAEQAVEEEAAVSPAAPPKVTEDLYLELMARSVIIREKYAEDSLTAEKEVEALYEKAGVAFADVLEFERKLGPANTLALQKKIQDKIQKLLSEYQ